MTFLSPIAGLVAGAIGAGLVLLMYMLRLRRRPVQVSSTLLWKRSVKDLEGNIPWQRLSPTMLLLLHLLIVVLISLAIARPVADGSLGDGQRVAIVIDTSASMNASLGDRTGLEIAKREAARRVRGLFDSGRSPSVSVIDAGLEARAVLLDSSERGRVLGAIDGLSGSDQPGDASDAIELLERVLRVDTSDEGSAGSTGETDKTRVWLLSDGGSIKEDSIAMRSGSGGLIPVFGASGVDENLSNLGIVALGAQRDRVDPELCRVFVRVIRSEQGATAGVVRIYEDSDLIESAPIVFEDGSDSATHTFELRLLRGALLRVELGGDDALAQDNRAWVSVPSPEPIRVSVVAPDAVANPLLVDFLEVIARGSVRVIAPGDPIGAPDLIVYDRVDTPELPALPSLGLGSATPGISSRIDEPSGIRRVLGWERNDPILRQTGIGSVSYVRSLEFDESGPGVRVLARDQGGAVLVEVARNGVRHVHAGFVLHDSDWAVQPGFTVFLAQLFEQLLPGAGGSGDVYRTSDVISYRDEDGGERAAGPFDRIGVRTLPDGRTIGLSLLDEGESALRTRVRLSIGTERSGSGGAGVVPDGLVRVDLWRWFVGIAIGLLMLEWVVYLRRVRVAL